MANVFVSVRFRPLNRKELGSNDANCILKDHQDERTGLKLQDEKVGEASFHFDRIFWPEASQKEVYTEIAEPIVKDALQGVNGTILAYGQTSAGKTHSMEGPNLLTSDRAERGILPRVAEALFTSIKSVDGAYEYLVKVSVVELYMEKLRDLLQTEKDNLSIRESAEKGIWIAEATEVFVQSELEMLQVLQAGVENRAVASTNMNNESSRSHCIYLISIIATHAEDRSVKTGKLHLVDLAGSEKVDKTGAEGQVLSEAKMINKSLSALGNVINALTDEKASFIPYRDSKLTRVLQESLGGNSRTALLCCCSTSSSNAQETLSTLRFGNRAKHVKNQPKVNNERSRAELERLLETTEKERDGLRKQVERLTYQIKLEPARESNPCNLALHPDAPSDSAEISRLKAKVSLLEQHLLRMKNQILQELSNMGTIRLHADGSYDQEGDLDRAYVALLEEIRSTDQGQAEDVGLSSVLPDGSKAVDGSEKHCGDSVSPFLQKRMERIAVSYKQALKKNARLTEEKRALERMVHLTKLKRPEDSFSQEPRTLRPRRGDSETAAPAKLDSSGWHDVHGLKLFRISPAAIWKHLGMEELFHKWARWH